MERFRLLVESARDHAIFMLDPTGNVLTWNSGAERLKGYSAEQIISRHFSVFYPQEDIDRGKPAHELEVAVAEGRYEDEGWRIRSDGSRFWANVIITALYKPEIGLIGFSKVTRDLTNRKKAEEALLLELSNAVLSGLDIQQMLTAIAGSIQQIVPNDYATIALYDRNADRLRVRELTAGSSEEIILPLEGSPAGWTFKNRQPLFMNHLNTIRFAPEMLQHQARAGVKSGCWLPLNSHGDIIGTLFIGSRRDAAFDPKNTETLLQMVECPVNFVPAELRQTGIEGAAYGTRKEARAGADRDLVAADRSRGSQRQDNARRLPGKRHHRADLLSLA